MGDPRGVDPVRCFLVTAGTTHRAPGPLILPVTAPLGAVRLTGPVSRRLLPALLTGRGSTRLILPGLVAPRSVAHVSIGLLPAIPALRLATLIAAPRALLR